jgi:hypothetical protein
MAVNATHQVSGRKIDGTAFGSKATGDCYQLEITGQHLKANPFALIIPFHHQEPIKGGIMKIRALSGMLRLSAICLIIGLGSPASAVDMDLVGLLTKNLGVSKTQATGGAGAIFDTASQKMSVEDFAKVKDAMPEVQALMDAAPKAEKSSGALGGLTSVIGKKSGAMSSLAGLMASFSKLGLSSDMVGKFVPIVLNYAQSKGGAGISNLLKSALQ